MASKDNQLVVGKKGLRWWYEGKQGKHKQVNTWNDQEKEIVDLSMSAAKDGDLDTLKTIASQGSVLPLKFDSTHSFPVCGNLNFVTSMVELLCNSWVCLRMSRKFSCMLQPLGSWDGAIRCLQGDETPSFPPPCSAKSSVQLLLQMKADPLARLFRGGGKGRTPMVTSVSNDLLQWHRL